MSNLRRTEWGDPLEESVIMTDTMDEWELAEANAYHEAGHAVAKYLLGRRFSRISIVPDEDTEDHITVLDSYWHSSGLDSGHDGAAREQILKDIMIGLAGEIAIYNLTARQDFAAMGAYDDLSAVDFLAGLVCTSYDEINAYVNGLRIRTKNLLLRQAHWAAVEALARALLRYEVIGYHRAGEIIGNAINGN